MPALSQTCSGNIKTCFKNKNNSMLWETGLDVLNKSCILSRIFLPALVFCITNFKYFNLGPSRSLTANNGRLNYWMFRNWMLLQEPEERDTHNWRAVLHIVAWFDHAWTSQMRHIVLQAWNIRSVSILSLTQAEKYSRLLFYTYRSYKINTHPPTVVSSDFTVYSCHFLFIPKNNNAAHVPWILSLTNFCNGKVSSMFKENYAAHERRLQYT